MSDITRDLDSIVARGHLPLGVGKLFFRVDDDNAREVRERSENRLPSPDDDINSLISDRFIDHVLFLGGPAAGERSDDGLRECGLQFVGIEFCCQDFRNKNTKEAPFSHRDFSELCNPIEDGYIVWNGFDDIGSGQRFLSFRFGRPVLFRLRFDRGILCGARLSLERKEQFQDDAERRVEPVRKLPRQRDLLSCKKSRQEDRSDEFHPVRGSSWERLGIECHTDEHALAERDRDERSGQDWFRRYVAETRITPTVKGSERNDINAVEGV